MCKKKKAHKEKKIRVTNHFKNTDDEIIKELFNKKMSKIINIEFNS